MHRALGKPLLGGNVLKSDRACLGGNRDGENGAEQY
jgi:hypothetical protein